MNKPGRIQRASLAILLSIRPSAPGGATAAIDGSTQCEAEIW